MASAIHTPKLIFINRYFYPDRSATSQMLSDLAFHLASEGYEVVIITSRQRYDDPTARLPTHERVGGLNVERVRTTVFGRRNLTGRAVDYASFYVSAALKLRQLVRAGDLVIAKTDPPMISIISLLVRHKGIGHINWIQDLFPEIAIELGFKMFRGPVGLLAKTLRNASLRRATINVAIGGAMADRLANLGVERDRIHIISNWSNDAVIHPILPADNALRREWSLSNKFVVGYSGNLGIPHETETLIGSAVRLRERDDIRFLFVGGGHNMEAVKARARVLHLDNFVFKPYQSKEILGETLSVPDLHWLSLRPELEGLILPSKLYGIAAAGRPVLAIAALDGEIAKLVIDHKCGFAIEPGASEELAAAITNLADNPERCQAMGQNARRMLDQNFTRESAMSAWERTLNAARQAIAQTSSVPLVATALTSGRRLSERNFDALRPDN